MNENKDEYGIELKLLTSSFKNSLKNVSTSIKNFAKNAKVDTTVDFSYNLSDFEKKLDINKLKEHIEDAMDNIEYYNKLLNDPKQASANKKMYNQQLQEEEARLASLNSRYEELNSNIKNIGNESEKTRNKINNTFSSSLKTSKKFLLSLFSIRSVYSLISRASSTYLSENNKLNSSVQLTSSLLGNTLAPVIKTIADWSQYAVIGISELIRLWTGYNALAKTTDNALKNISKSGNKANESLASFDTITNLSDNSNGIDVDSIVDAQNALDDFQKKVKEVQEIFEKYETPIKLASGAMAVLFGANMLSKIGKIIGSASGLTGLTGVQALLTGLAVAGTIYLAVEAGKGIYDTIKTLKELKQIQKDILDQNNKLIDKSEEIAQKYIDMSNAGEIDIATQKSIIEVQKDKVSGMKAEIEHAKEQLRLMGDGIIVGHGYKEGLLKTIETAKIYSDELINMANATDLSDSEQKELIETLKLNIQNAEKGREGLKKYGKEYQTAGTYIDSMKSSLEKLTGKKYNTSLTIDANMDTSKADKDYSNWLTKLANKTTSALGSLFSGLGKGNTSSLVGNLFKNLLHFDVGTTYVPNDTLAVIHKGEQIIPKKWNPATSGIYNSSPEVVSKLDELIDVLINKDMNAYISKKDIGRASSSYSKEQSRIMNRSGA